MKRRRLRRARFVCFVRGHDPIEVDVYRTVDVGHIGMVVGAGRRTRCRRCERIL